MNRIESTYTKGNGTGETKREIDWSKRRRKKQTPNQTKPTHPHQIKPNRANAKQSKTKQTKPNQKHTIPSETKRYETKIIETTRNGAKRNGTETYEIETKINETKWPYITISPLPTSAMFTFSALWSGTKAGRRRRQTNGAKGTCQPRPMPSGTNFWRSRSTYIW